MRKLTMLALFVLVALTASCVPPAEQITGSGKLVTQEEAISGFDKVEIGSAFEADVSQGESFGVIIRIDDNLLEYLRVSKQGSALVIDLDADRVVRNATLEAEVTMPDLTGVTLRGASDATITGFRSAADLDVDLRGASSLRGDIEAGPVKVSALGASDMALSGSAGDADIDAKGGSIVDLADFPVADATVVASGASKVTVNVNGTLDVDARSASHVDYLGSPTLGAVSESGGSEVRAK